MSLLKRHYEKISLSIDVDSFGILFVCPPGCGGGACCAFVKSSASPNTGGDCTLADSQNEGGDCTPAGKKLQGSDG
jgi:hypothetical protein